MTERHDAGSREGREEVPLRRILLALVLIGATGLLAELLLLEHTESVWQWIPLVLLAGALGVGAAVALRPSKWFVRSFRAVMLLCVAAGVLGLYLHYQGNAEFELEMDRSLRRLDLFWRSMRGATPALAPGAMIQLGLLGLVAVYRHPALLAGREPAGAATAASSGR